MATPSCHHSSLAVFHTQLSSTSTATAELFGSLLRPRVTRLSEVSSFCFGELVFGRGSYRFHLNTRCWRCFLFHVKATGSSSWQRKLVECKTVLKVYFLAGFFYVRVYCTGVYIDVQLIIMVLDTLTGSNRLLEVPIRAPSGSNPPVCLCSSSSKETRNKPQVLRLRISGRK